MFKKARLVIGRCLGSCREPGISETLSDPIVRAVMEADGVNPQAFEAELRNMARKLSVMRRRDSGASGGPRSNEVASGHSRYLRRKGR